MIVGTLGVALVIGAALYAIDPGAPVVLAANLNPADRTALALRLRRHDIRFTLGADSITVGARDVNAARALLQSSPGFSGGAEDFTLFDRSTMGQSDFDEQVNYQRSLQGELERTIMDIHGIDSARVMLAMGRPSPFALGPSEAEHASVMLTTAPGASIDAATAEAIAHLVANSVRGLDLDGITVTGNDGAVLYPVPKNDGELGEAMRLRNDFEHRLEGKVSALLTRIMGENRYAVQIAVDVDSSHVSSTETQYGKGDTTILSEEHSQTPVGAGPASGGVPGLTSNLPNASNAQKVSPSASASALPSAAATTTAQTESQSDNLARKDVVNYKPSMRETHSETEPFRIKRITVAAVLDGTYEHGAYKPLDDARLHAIKELVTAAVGADVSRGDSIDVQTAPLSQPYVAPLPNPIDQFRIFIADPVHLYETAGVALLMFIILIWMMKRALSRRSARKHAVVEAAAEKIEEQPAAPAAVETPAPAPASEQKPDRGFDEIRRKVNEEVERNPEAAAEILRRWLAEGVAAGNGNAAP
ncbi:MAG TPA: flagellar basal-body MS-ring/collar protein FliF, partial [Candidatus Binataceae bacterium]|nr:flagellar basal-body MS-ring/collar protein FliF [Candidatus Binataceae bacterium]